MKLQANTRYVRRDGTISPPLVIRPYEDEGNYWLLDEETDFLFSDDEPDGNMVSPTIFGKHPKDLMSEYVEKSE